MNFPKVLLKLADCMVYQVLPNLCLKAESMLKTQHSLLPLNPTFTKYNIRNEQTLVCDIQNTLLLNSKSFFPYFLLVAFEGGSILRACFLLYSYPLLLFLNNERSLKLMIFITFCAMKMKNMENVSRTVLAKFYLENLNFQVYELVFGTRKEVGTKVVVLTSVPRVMVEGFCIEYLSVEKVVGTELHCVGGYFSGFVATSGVIRTKKVAKQWFRDGRKQDNNGDDGSSVLEKYKEAYAMSYEDSNMSSRTKMPRDKYPKPLVFHDGRLTSLPTPLATLAMFLWFPFGILLALIRLFVGAFFPCKVTIFVCALTGLKIRVKGCDYLREKKTEKGNALFVCSHRTLLDPIALTLTVGKPLTTVTYGISKMSEMISPIRTIRLIRDRKKDGEIMHKLLSEGDLVIFPEGTTCREPYLLRFSSLFAELTDKIVPVAMNTEVTMFYGTTVSGHKWLDPIYFLMNPRPTYHVQVLEKLGKELTCGLGGNSSHDVANHIQKQLGHALGFKCTTLTRRDKYLMLATNQGIADDCSKMTKVPFLK